MSEQSFYTPDGIRIEDSVQSELDRERKNLLKAFEDVGTELFSEEEIQDIIASLLVEGTDITLDYQDSNDNLVISASTSGEKTEEEIEDIVDALLSPGSNISLNYDDANDTLTISATDTTRTDEEIEDVVGSLLSSGSNITLDYDDTNDTLTISGTDTTRSDEEIEDVVGSLVSAGNGINVNYDDANDTLTISAVQKENFTLSNTHTEWADGLSSEEIYRLNLQSGESLTVERIEFRGKGGSTSTASIDVYDATNSTVIGSAQQGNTTIDPGSSGDGSTVLVRISNSTGASIQASLNIQGTIS